MQTENIRSIKFMTPDEQAIVSKLLAAPQMERSLNRLAETLMTELPRIVQQLAHMKHGDIFTETGQCKTVQSAVLTGKNEDVVKRRYVFVGPAVPLKPHVIARMVTELTGAAHVFSTPTNDPFIIYHDDVGEGAVAAFYVCTTRDFCRMFALGEWQLVTPVEAPMNREGVEDQFEQTGILDQPEGVEDALSQIVTPKKIITP